MPEWYCPTCGGPNAFPTPKDNYECSYCRRRLGLLAVVCPICGCVSPEELDNCPNCDEPLSMVGNVFHRHETAGGPPPWLQRNREQSQQVKMEALAHSEARMEQFQQIERERLAAIRQADRIQREKDRRLLFISLAIAAAIIFAIFVFALMKPFFQ